MPGTCNVSDEAVSPTGNQQVTYPLCFISYHAYLHVNTPHRHVFQAKPAVRIRSSTLKGITV